MSRNTQLGYGHDLSEFMAFLTRRGRAGNSTVAAEIEPTPFDRNVTCRCPRCNGRLIIADKDAIANRLEPNTLKYFNLFWQCQACGQVYWRGSHVERILDRLQGILPDG